MKIILKNIFKMKKFPVSMSKDIMLSRYLRYMALNSWATSFSNVLSTNSMLNSIVGTTPTYTSVLATTYIGKDIIGQLGGLTYAWRTGKKADQQPIAYVTKGALIQQISFYLENASPFIKNGNLVLPFLGVSSTLKNVSFIATGAVNANNLQKLSNGNIGEFYSKVASLNTFASTFGMVSGIVAIHLIPSYTVRTLTCMPILTCISVYSLRKATEIANSDGTLSPSLPTKEASLPTKEASLPTKEASLPTKEAPK